jgi:hypothetical protein
MKNIILYFALVFVLLSNSGTIKAQHPLLKEDIEAVLQLIQNKSYPDFQAFLNDIDQRTTNISLQSTIRKFRKDEHLSEGDNINIYRLMGIFVRSQYKDRMLAVLKEQVEIPTD